MSAINKLEYYTKITASKKPAMTIKDLERSLSKIHDKYASNVNSWKNSTNPQVIEGRIKAETIVQFTDALRRALRGDSVIYKIYEE